MAPRTLHRQGTLIFALLFAFTALLSPHTLTQAQGSRTFPETGKTVTGKFLQYWDGNGGLAQQGFPISSEIQETSETNGKIYTVQYFERAVFEHHPENAGKPSEVLLQLLGTFLYGQKYPQGAPGAVPNNEPGSRLYAETGKRLGGIFLQYWNSHGGLAQQGFPISDEFTEKSDLDGKSYKVQYFERAVFEYHPENSPPFDVLLSQLGTFRNRANYGHLTSQLSGTGNNPHVHLTLKAGLAVLQSVRADNEGYFYINLVDSSGVQLATIGFGTGPRDLSDAVPIPADGAYMLDVQAEGGWTVNVSQPKATYSPPPATQSFAGSSYQATPLFSLKAGTATFHFVSTNSTDIVRVTLLDQDGRHVGQIANTDTKGPADVTTPIEVPADGIYLVHVQCEGDWTLEIKQ